MFVVRLRWHGVFFTNGVFVPIPWLGPAELVVTLGKCYYCVTVGQSLLSGTFVIPEQ